MLISSTKRWGVYHRATPRAQVYLVLVREPFLPAAQEIVSADVCVSRAFVMRF